MGVGEKVGNNGYGGGQNDIYSKFCRLKKKEPEPYPKQWSMAIGTEESGCVLPAHTVKRLSEDLRCHAMLMLQDQALLQGD